MADCARDAVEVLPLLQVPLPGGHTELELAERAPRASVDSWVYVPPPLQEQSLGWYPEWMKAWDGWGMPAYSM